MDVRKPIPKQELREIFPTVGTLYNYLEDKKGLYLPFYGGDGNRDQSITVDYLFEILKGTAFSIRRENIKKPPRVKKACLKWELQEKIEKVSNKKCLFPEGRLPSKEWLLEVLYSLDPSDEVFTMESELEKSVFKEVTEEYYKFINNQTHYCRTYKEIKSLPKIKVKNTRTFKFTKAEREKVISGVKKKRIQRNKFKLAGLQAKKKAIEKVISSLEL